MAGESRKGVFMSVMASSLFGLMYYYTSLLKPLTGEEIFGWRMALSVPMITLMIVFSKDWHWVTALLGRLRQEPHLLIAIPCTSFLLGMQLLLFMWAPLHGLSLEVSLGYFILPLSLIVAGRLVYQERLSRFQSVAALLGALGICNELFHTGALSWPALVINMGYPVYFIARKKLGIDNIGGLWMETVLTLPLALWFIVAGAHQQDAWGMNPQLPYLIVGLGVISTSALMCYVLSSRILPMGLFGLLGYVEPVLLVFASLLMGDTIEGHAWWTFIPIWLAVATLALEGLIQLRKPAAPTG